MAITTIHRGRLKWQQTILVEGIGQRGGPTNDLTLLSGWYGRLISNDQAKLN